jgi:hypothetical protein
VNHALFVAPALRKLGGELGVETTTLPFGRWRGDARPSNPREQHLPVTVTHESDGTIGLWPVRWNGSADIVGISACHALAVAPLDRPLEPGALLAYRRLA